jgi:hypothetical protein
LRAGGSVPPASAILPVTAIVTVFGSVEVVEDGRPAAPFVFGEFRRRWSPG